MIVITFKLVITEIYTKYLQIFKHYFIDIIYVESFSPGICSQGNEKTCIE